MVDVAAARIRSAIMRITSENGGKYLWTMRPRIKHAFRRTVESRLGFDLNLLGSKESIVQQVLFG